MDNNDLIVINKQDLNTDYVKNRIKEERESKRDLNKAERIPVQNSILLNPVFYTAVCGFISALLGWGIVEPLVDINPNYIVWFPIIIVTLLCTSISSIDSLLSGNIIKALIKALIGFGLGLLWGIFGGILAGAIMNLLSIIITMFIPQDVKPDGITLEITFNNLVIAMMSRAPAWAFLGFGAGFIPGIANYSMKLSINGLIGGMLGGFLGGFIFDPIAFSTGNTSAVASRCIGFAALSILIGLFVGLVENIAKDVWVTMNSGPLRGKQFVIYHNPTLIGSSPKSDIYIFKDPNVMPTHAKIQRKGNKYEIIDSSNGVGVYVNSNRINGSKILEANDTIIVGQSILEFQQKERK